LSKRQGIHRVGGDKAGGRVADDLLGDHSEHGLERRRGDAKNSHADQPTKVQREIVLDAQGWLSLFGFETLIKVWRVTREESFPASDVYEIKNTTVTHLSKDRMNYPLGLGSLYVTRGEGKKGWKWKNNNNACVLDPDWGMRGHGSRGE